MSIWEHMVMNHFTTVLLVILCGIKLHSQKKARDVEMRYFWVTLLSCFLLAIQDAMETYAATDPDLRFWRVLFSVIGYILWKKRKERLEREAEEARLFLMEQGL